MDVPAPVLVTGAAGFIGAELTRRLRASGFEVRAVDVRDAPGVIRGSTTEPEAWADALDGVQTVIHTAAIVSNRASLDDAWHVNVVGTHRTLRAAIAAGARRFVHVSSVTVFGMDFPDGVDETYPARLTGFSYPDSRINSEHVVLAAHAAGEIEATIVRPGDVIGPGSVWVREAVARARAGQLVLPIGGRGVLSPVDIDDLIDGMLRATAPAASGHIVTLTGGYGVACADYFGAVAALAGGRVRAVPDALVLPLVRAGGAVARVLRRDTELSEASVRMLARPGTYSIDRARSLLGYAPRHDFESTLARLPGWIA
jgi:nucleoside-diphosphate-sugar epimerase